MKPILKIGFTGFGNMAKALIQGLSKHQQYQLFAASPSLTPGQIEQLITHSDNRHIVENADIVILAVKPHQMAGVLKEISPVLPPHCLLVSLAAGLSLAWLAQHTLPKQAIVRCMPNIAVAFGKGATPMMANDAVTDQQKQAVSTLFNQVGISLWIDRETDMDIFTALSGSGPAYVFLFLEALMKGAEKLGMDAQVAYQFSLQTLAGASHFLEQTLLSPEEARTSVTSENGTTAAAINLLQEQGFKEGIAKAMEAAFLRSKDLGK